jgi:phosphoesterase RecJ-like protein
MMEELLKIRNLLITNKEVAIISHSNPDGDALGSQIALSLALEKLGIQTLLINKDPVPPSYHFLPNSEIIIPLSKKAQLPGVLIFLDCATLERTGYETEFLNKQGRIFINIDHHISNDKYADINWVEEKAAATAEMIYDLISLLQVKIDKDIATALYTGISTDTGSFLYENTTSTTHQIASDLINKGANISELRINFYENMSKGRLNLLKKGLNNLSFAQNDKIGWMAFTYSELTNSDAVDSDGDGLINYVKNISEVEVALVFREIEPGKTKVSLRSKSWFDVNQLAAVFQGGGHARAAGCVIEGDQQEIVKKVISKAQESFLQGGHIR